VGQQRTSSLAFSSSGRILAAGTDPGAPVSLWDVVAGQIVGQARNEFARVESLIFSPDDSRLALGGYSSAVLVYDVAALCGKKQMEEITKSTALSAEDLEGLWAELSGADSVRAYRAIRKLALTGLRGADFLKRRLKGAKPPDERRIARLIADLDNDRFATREEAFAELSKLGVRAEPALRRTLQGEATAEVRLRVNRLLEALGPSQRQLPSHDLVQLRAVEALEANGSKEARQVLAELAEEATDPQLGREVKASLARLRSRRIQP
jgi:hypothetical protein